jgi:hypothetical protein
MDLKFFLGRLMDRTIRAIIEAKYERCVTRVVHRLRRIRSDEWQGDDAPERTLWDHWKREMQGEHSRLHDLLEDVVEDVVSAQTAAILLAADVRLELPTVLESVMLASSGNAPAPMACTP